MTHEQQTNKRHEHGESMPEGIASEHVGNGTYDDGWQPGTPDPNVEVVKAHSAPDTPGIRARERLVDYGGILVTTAQARQLGLID